jgi:hypothetical protein
MRLWLCSTVKNLLIKIPNFIPTCLDSWFCRAVFKRPDEIASGVLDRGEEKHFFQKIQTVNQARKTTSTGSQ